MATNCKTCVHKKVCDLWRKEECQSARSFFEDECELYDEMDPERKTGKWINHTEPDQSNNIMCWCSECGAGDQHAVGVEVPYCWKCGAKMQDSTRGKYVGEMLGRIINQYMQHKEEPHD